MDIGRVTLVSLVLMIMLVGLAGTILPIVPDLILIWLAGLAYGLISGFGDSGPWMFGFMTLMMTIGYGVSLLIPHVGAAQAGASWQALAASLVLATIGFFLIPVVGAAVGAVLGIFLVEYQRRKNAREAWRTTTGTLIGFALGLGTQVATGVLMILAWGAWVWLG
ncbi:MAG: DUF456 domain-containing protein [Chloroflexi bacterium]|nr:DUF456 domain-containing protein [Chloroflexota bacterium]